MGCWICLGRISGGVWRGGRIRWGCCLGLRGGGSCWGGFYAEAPEIRAATGVLCDFVREAVGAYAGEGGEVFSVLEVGAGTGGTTRHLLPVLEAAGVRFRYTFTELSGSLLNKARRGDFAKVEGVEFGRLDVEREVPEELKGGYHLVVSSNCVHVTRDLRTSLGNIREMLRPDGCLALVELTQAVPWFDLVWGLLDGCWLFEDGRDYPLQSPWSWERAMIDAGFAHADYSEGASRESRAVRVVCGFASEPRKNCASKASAMLLHRGSGERNLFLAPDGFGSGAVFGALQPMLDGVKDTSVYALNSPFLKNKPNPDHPPALEELAAIYVAEIKRRQPNGPYLVGGYGIGGVVAYEICRQLLEDGNQVEKLLLIDTACPTNETTLPDSLVEFIDSIGKIGMVDEERIRQKSKGRLVASDHFMMSSRQLRTYKTSKLPVGKMPQVVLVSARDGVNKQSDLPKPAVSADEQWIVDWFLDDRTDVGPLGWDKLLGESVEVIRADGNHFSIMTPPSINRWGLKIVEMLNA